MTVEEAKQDIVSVLAEAGNNNFSWMDHIEMDEINMLLSAITIIRVAKRRVGSEPGKS